MTYRRCTCKSGDHDLDGKVGELSKPKFVVSHPAQTVYRVLGGGPPTNAEEVARAALEAARKKRRTRPAPPDHCLNDAGYGRNLCADCRTWNKPQPKAPKLSESELRAMYGDR